MKKTYLVMIMYCILSFCSCSNSSDMVIVDTKKCVQPSDLIKPDFDIIPLETNEESLISQINKVKLYDSCFFIEDQNQRAILIFDINGKYLNKISRYGRGRGEYIDIMDFDIYNGYIYLLSRGLGKILRYDLKGKYIDSSGELDDDYTNIIVMNDNNILMFANSCGTTSMNYKILDWKSNEILSEWDNYGKNAGMIMSGYFMNRTEDGFLLSKAYDHTLYKYDTLGYDKLIALEFPSTDKIPDKPQNFFEKSKYIHSRGMCVIECIDQAMIYNNLLYIYYSCMETRIVNGIEAGAFMTYMSEINLETKESHTIDLSGYTVNNDYPFLGLRTAAMQDGCLITKTPCSTIIHYKTECLTQFPKLANIKEDDNPVLIVHHIK